MKKFIKDIQMNEKSLDEFIWNFKDKKKSQIKQINTIDLKDFSKDDWTFKKANTKEGCPSLLPMQSRVSQGRGLTSS